MIRTVQVQNYKSILDLKLDLGRVTVLIGANGSGKSNILEAIALASAAAHDKLDNEFLISRGIRVTETRFMRSGFGHPTTNTIGVQKSDRREKKVLAPDPNIKVLVQTDNEGVFDCELSADEKASYAKWEQKSTAYVRFLQDLDVLLEELGELKAEQIGLDRPSFLDKFTRWSTQFKQFAKAYQQQTGTLPDFLVYAPENSALRTFQTEGQLLPLGIRGEGLFAHLKALNSGAHKKSLAKIKEKLSLIEWFEGFDIPEDLSPGERSVRIRDRYLPDDALFDQRSANEGFLFLLFYITLFISPETPAFFSIDNIDVSLNPKLCIALLKQLVLLAKEYNKQVILTTHNPAILDGLDLHDDEQRLLVVERNKLGHTRTRRVDPPRPVAGQPPVSLSEAFLRGYIGGLPKNF
jgi:energy-coupling factor transporter ATP-binding protein EcfA2